MSILKKLSMGVLFFLLSCGEQSRLPSSGIKGRDPLTVPEVQSLTKSKSVRDFSKVESELIEPESFGQPWQRRVRFKDLPPQRDLIFEKLRKNQSGFYWEAIGVTDAQGWGLDDDVSSVTQYRLGRKLISPQMEAIQDKFLDGQLKENASVKAYRVVIPGDFFIGKHTLLVEATIFRVDGGVYAYPKDSLGTGNAGTLSINATYVRGKGLIALAGQRGNRGATGAVGKKGVNQSCQRLLPKQAVGASGKDGQNGGRGGNGGNVTIFSEELLLETVSAPGGSGGRAGKPGRGGLGGAVSACLWQEYFAHCEGLRRYQKCAQLSKRAPSGAPGKPGAVGRSGEDGLVLLYDRSTW